MKKIILILILIIVTKLLYSQSTPTLTKVLNSSNNGGGLQIKNIADPTLAQDAATKAYVDANVISTPVSVANGGTGAANASGARTNLGLVIGTDILAPNGSAASLTNFPTFNQNTTGTAANVTGIVAVANGGTNSSSTATSGTILRGNGTAWLPTTATYPNTIGASEVPYATSADIIGSNSDFRYNGNGISIGTTAAVSSTPFIITRNSTTPQQLKFTNSSTGTSTYAGLYLENSTSYFQFRKHSTGYTPSGMITANSGWIGNQGGDLILECPSSNSIIFGMNSTEYIRFEGGGNVGVGVNDPSAFIHIKSGTSVSAPLKFESGSNLSTAEAGAMEYNGTNLFFTRSGTTRENVITSSSVNVVSPTSPNRTITVVIDGTTYYISAKTTND